MDEIKPLLARIQSLKDASGVALSGTQLWHFSCNGELSLFSTVFPNFGHILDWRILLECPQRT
jgi:hypothetical protein